MFEGLGTDLRSYERRSVFTFMILYLGGIMLFGSVILWWYGYNQNRRIHKEEKIALKLYDLQCKRVLKNAPEGFSCPIEKPDFKNSYESLKYELFIAAGVLFLFATVLSFYLATLSLRPMREAVDMIDEFAKSMIHDLNTPITTAQLNLATLENEKLSHTQQKRLQRVKKSLLMLQDLEEKLKSAISFAQVEYKESRLLLCKLCETLIQRYDLISLECKNEISIFADEIMITRLLDNLISNAVKYNKNDNRIDILLFDTKLRIADKGVGIENIEQIFEPYYREKGSIQGLGLGLGIVKRVCDHYDIKLDVESKKGFGTVITLNFETLCRKSLNA